MTHTETGHAPGHGAEAAGDGAGGPRAPLAPVRVLCTRGREQQISLFNNLKLTIKNVSYQTMFLKYLL